VAAFFGGCGGGRLLPLSIELGHSNPKTRFRTVRVVAFGGCGGGRLLPLFSKPTNEGLPPLSTPNEEEEEGERSSSSF
tara:strand:- start:30 stop:263 length:234 start_codon:yes stop_codon:yes gene_type:complete